MSDHAILSPSACKKWAGCPASALMERDIPNTSSDDADAGTAQHECAAYCLTKKIQDVNDCLGMEFNGIIIDEDMVLSVQSYVDKLRELSDGHTLLVEQKLPIGHITAEKGAEGTSDGVVLYNDGTTLGIDDAKFGYHKVMAKKNPQLMLYASGARHKYAALGDFTKFVGRIHQPRINHYDEWEFSLKELEKFEEDIKFKVNFIWRLLRNEVEFKPQEDLVPSDDNCQWCRAKATCPARVNQALTIAAGEFTDLTKNPTEKLNKALHKVEHLDMQQLSWLMQNADTLESIAKAARRRVELELFAGREVPGFKIVEGKKGNRKWLDEIEVAETMSKLKVPKDLIYTKEVISVSKAEKLLKKDKKVWVKLHDLITQTEGKPSVAASTDPRPVLQVGGDPGDFEVIKDE